MKVAVVLAVIVGLLALSIVAQEQKPAPTDPTSRITLEVNRVNLLFTVSDKKGRFVTDLGKDDFDISENKKRINTEKRVFGGPTFLGQPGLTARVPGRRSSNTRSSGPRVKAKGRLASASARR